MNTINSIDEVIERFDDGYYNEQEFEACCLNGNFSLFHQNIRSFDRNYDDLSVFVNRLNRPIDVLVLTETWFSDMVCSDIAGFNSYHTFRSNKTGEGVSIYVRDCFLSHCIEEKSVVSNLCESCAVEVIFDKTRINEKILIFGIYRPPSSPLPGFVQYIESVNEEYSNKSMAYVGDFNINIMDERLSIDLVNVMYSSNLFPLINIPTRVTESSAKCLDHIWYNKLNVSHCGVFRIDFSDHYLIFCLLTITVNNSPMQIKIRDHSEANIANLLDSLSVLLQLYFNQTAFFDVDQKTEFFLNNLF